MIGLTIDEGSYRVGTSVAPPTRRASVAVDKAPYRAGDFSLANQGNLIGLERPRSVIEDVPLRDTTNHHVWERLRARGCGNDRMHQRLAFLGRNARLCG
jgi:hypothetical protein